MSLSPVKEDLRIDRNMFIPLEATGRKAEYFVCIICHWIGCEANNCVQTSRQTTSETISIIQRRTQLSLHAAIS
jgi:hypothetical protein